MSRPHDETPLQHIFRFRHFSTSDHSEVKFLCPDALLPDKVRRKLACINIAMGILCVLCLEGAGGRGSFPRCPCQDPAGNRTTRRTPDHRKETQTAVVGTCLPFVRSSQNHLARHSERGKKADTGRGGKTTSGNGQAWSSPSPRAQWRIEKSGNWLWNHPWFPNDCHGWGIDDDDDDDDPQCSTPGDNDFRWFCWQSKAGPLAAKCNILCTWLE